MASINLQLPNGASIAVKQEAAPVVSIQNGNVQGGTSSGNGNKFDAHFKKNFTNLAWTKLGNSYEQTVVHNLGKKPAVQVFDNYDNLLILDVEHVDTNTVKLTTKSLFSGTVYMN